MATYYAGTSGDLTFDSITLKVISWNFTDEGTEIETTNKSSGGYFEGMIGKRKGSGSCEAIWDGDILYGDPPVIKSGNSAAFALPLSDASGADSISGTAYVNSVAYTHDLDGTFKYTMNFTATGRYYLPGETVA